LSLLFWKENIKESCHSDDRGVGTRIILKRNSRNITAGVCWIYLVQSWAVVNKVKHSVGILTNIREAWRFLGDGG